AALICCFASAIKRATCRASCNDASVVLAGSGSKCSVSVPIVGGGNSGSVDLDVDAASLVRSGKGRIISRSFDPWPFVVDGAAKFPQSSGGNPILQTFPGNSSSSST